MHPKAGGIPYSCHWRLAQQDTCSCRQLVCVGIGLSCGWSNKNATGSGLFLFGDLSRKFLFFPRYSLSRPDNLVTLKLYRIFFRDLNFSQLHVASPARMKSAALRE